ncbi:hypothetical protein TNCV_954361 [Trichonephila clavipes]|nr:hypothetical protein TNCV_954361 [Trichonephila clavipes]
MPVKPVAALCPAFGVVVRRKSASSGVSSSNLTEAQTCETSSPRVVLYCKVNKTLTWHCIAKFGFFTVKLRLRAKTVLCFWLHATTGQPDCTLSAAVLSFFIETRGESETYKKDGTDKDYTTNRQRFNISQFC